MEMKHPLYGNIYSGKKILITGDTGFKGSWLAIWLKEMGAAVYGFALPPKTKEDNFVITGLKDQIHHKDGDIRSYEELKGFFDAVQPDMAFHLAAQALVLDSYQIPAETFQTNVQGTVNFFECVRKTPSVKVAVNITSDKCYRNNEWERGYQEDDPMGGKDPYSASKGCSELVTASYLNSFFSAEGTCHIASARAGNVIGGGDRAENRIVPDFFRALQSGQTLILRNPFSVRPWQHVLEPLGGYLLLGFKLFTEGKKFSGGWNFGPEKNNHHSVEELIEKLSADFPEARWENAGTKQKLHEASLLYLDITKAKKFLGWAPALDFEKTVTFTAQGYRDEMEGGDVYGKRVRQIERHCSLAK